MSVSIDDWPSYPIVGPAESVMRFLRGETVWPEDIEEDDSRSDVWAVNKDQYRRWRILSPEHHPPLED